MILNLKSEKKKGAERIHCLIFPLWHFIIHQQCDSLSLRKNQINQRENDHAFDLQVYNRASTAPYYCAVNTSCFITQAIEESLNRD